MRRLFTLVVLVLIVGAGVGFYRGWFAVSRTDSEGKPSVTISMDREKLRADEQKAVQAGKDAAQVVSKQVGKLKQEPAQPPSVKCTSFTVGQMCERSVRNHSGSRATACMMLVGPYTGNPS